jgi:hypothetical protein
MIEGTAGGGKGIEARGANVGIAVAAQALRSVLIRKHKEDVGLFFGGGHGNDPFLGPACYA